MAYIGRFAPSPTGALHFGSLVAALASWLDARAAGGTWQLRMEDLDRLRERRGAAATILRQLEAAGLEWDGPVIYQSARAARYDHALEQLQRAGLTYACGCTRREMADSSLAIDGARIYPGSCRNGLAPGRPARALRLRVPADPIRFDDRLQGEIAQSVAREVGDFVLLRADGAYAYQLAVVVDDAAQGVTDVVRGADLLDSTPRQILLQRLLGLPTPRYLHLPVALDAVGEKLAKHSGAASAGAGELARALRFLGHQPPDELPVRELLAWAKAHWDIRRIPRRRTMQC
ncbi:MAG: tRNA glutamyl-Q(34) synthetase GluQRS [Betaproteobacteria bacterium RIFCSPLOWO2_02_FULL_68_150]|nr:MAG: tRNA glutamyl-Q(34) synthetase GluQRS [Betaproteobacteria bacterium RIFCSPLOWO2_02_FULL_68_150]